MGKQVAEGKLVNNNINVFLHNCQHQVASDAYIHTFVVQNQLDLFLKCSE